MARLKGGGVPSFLGERVIATLWLGVGVMAIMGLCKSGEGEYGVVAALSFANSLIVWPMFYYLHKDWQESNQPTDTV